MLWEAWQAEESERVERLIAEVDAVDHFGYLVHYAVNAPKHLKKENARLQAKLARPGRPARPERRGRPAARAPRGGALTPDEREIVRRIFAALHPPAAPADVS